MTCILRVHHRGPVRSVHLYDDVDRPAVHKGQD